MTIIYIVSMYIERVPNRSSPPAVLLRESYREAGHVRKRTLCNLTHWSEAKVELLRRLLRNEALVPLDDAFEVVDSKPHGHVYAVLGALRRLHLERVLHSSNSRQRQLVVGMIVSRLVHPQSKLATTRTWNTTTLGELVGASPRKPDELYEALEWLLSRQARIEKALARRQLSEGSLVLCDVTSAYFEGRHCRLTQRGYSRDGKQGQGQIVFGLLTTKQGCPVAVEVFEGNTADPLTLSRQINKMRGQFKLERLVLVGDRGLLTSARIREELRPNDIDWITALRAPAIRKLKRNGSLQLSLFDERDLAEIKDPDFPEERLVVCKNPLLAEERRRKRQELLAATEAELERIAAATRRDKRALRGQDKIALRVGRVLGRYHMSKHFRLNIRDDGLSYERDEAHIAEEAALDGLYVVRTSVAKHRLSSEEAVRAYKSLSNIERAFRSLKTIDLQVRPIRHWKETRVRAHVLLCMLAYYVEWHMRQWLAPVLFDDHEKPSRSGSPVAPARRSEAAEAKARTQKLPDGTPVHSFRSLLAELGTVIKNQLEFKAMPELVPHRVTVPTPRQRRVFDLLKLPSPT